MANQKQLDILKRGVETWNQWRRVHPDRQPDFSGAALGGNLSGANLSKAFLSGANLSFANLSEADLNGAILNGAQLSETNLNGAFLYGANLNEANLSHANLSGAELGGAALWRVGLWRANLSKANLNGAFLSEAFLSGANLNGANLNGANLSGAILTRAVLVETNLSGATLTQCSIYGISAWDVKLEGAIQDSLVITSSNEPIITVDDLEVAQFIYLLLNHKKLRNVLNAVTERGILILGRFGGGGVEVLRAMAAQLRTMGYLPMIFDFERPQDHDYTETVKTLVGLARFVIVDLSGPSVPQELSHTVPFFDIPFVPIIEKGRNVYSMFRDLLKYDWVLRPPIEFATVEELLARLPTEVIAPAEKKHQARQKLLDELFKKA